MFLLLTVAAMVQLQQFSASRPIPALEISESNIDCSLCIVSFMQVAKYAKAVLVCVRPVVSVPCKCGMYVCNRRSSFRDYVIYFRTVIVGFPFAIALSARNPICVARQLSSRAME